MSGGLGLGAHAPNPVLGMTYGGMHVNSSGMQGDVPPEAARGFNLGAAVSPLTFWWLRNHNLRPVGWGIAIGFFILRTLAQNIPGFKVAGLILVAILQVGVFLALGFLGNRLAWQNRRFDDVEDFKACQRIWMYWAIPVFCIQVGLNIIGIMAAVALGSMGALNGAGGVGGPGGFGSPGGMHYQGN